MTPAQASGNPNQWINDWPVQGPTDPGIRAADCWWVKNALPTQSPACVDCKTRGGLLGAAFSDWGLGAVGDPDIADRLTPEQQGWVAGGISHLAPKGECPPGSDLAGMIKCFQNGYNRETASLPVRRLRTDGVLDEDTLCALQSFVADNGGTPFPDPTKTYCQSPQPVTGTSSLSKGAIAGIAAAGAVVVGGIVYAVTRTPRRR